MQLAFTVQITDAEVNLAIAPAVEVAIQDAFGNTVTSATNAVTLAIGTNPGGGTLSGLTTVDAVAGIASFVDLAIDRTGSGYTFMAVVSAGSFHTCGVTTGGSAYCWGFNGSGQLGDGTTTQRLTPTLVSGGLSFASLSAADFHTCGVTTGGSAYCWGFNGNGQLGDGTTTDSSTPVRVSDPQ